MLDIYYSLVKYRSWWNFISNYNCFCHVCIGKVHTAVASVALAAASWTKRLLCQHTHKKASLKPWPLWPRRRYSNLWTRILKEHTVTFVDNILWLRIRLNTAYRHSTCISRVAHAVSIPSSELGPPPHPSPGSECVTPLPLNQREGGLTRLGGKGVGETQFGRLEKKPIALFLLYDML